MNDQAGHARCNSVQANRKEDYLHVNFGDDQAIQYSDETINLNKEDRENLAKLVEEEHKLRISEVGHNGVKHKDENDTKAPKNLGKTLPFNIEDNPSQVKSEEIKTTSTTQQQPLVTESQKAVQSGHPNVEIEAKPKNSTQSAKSEDEDPYGMGNGGDGKALVYEPKALEQFKEKLMVELLNEFKEGFTQQENLPRGNLLLNAVKACLNDENKLVKRGILDLVNAHVRLTDSLLLTEDNKVELVEAMLHLLIKRDLSITRRIYLWFFGDADDDNSYVIDQTKRDILDYISMGFQRIFTSFEPDDIKTCSAPLKILQNFYMDHEKAVDQTIGSIALPIIRYIYFKGVMNKDEKIKEEISKSGIRFLSCISSHFYLIVEQISMAITTATDQELISYCGIIRFIKDCFSNPELQIAELKVEIKLLEGLTAFILRIKITDLIDSYIVNDFDRIKLTLKVLEIFTEVLIYIYTQPHSWSRQELQTMVLSIPSINKALESFEKDFIDLSKVLSSFKMEEDHINFKDSSGEEQMLNEELPPILIRALRQSILSVVIMQKVVYTTKNPNVQTYPPWMVALVTCIKSSEPNICKIAIEGLIFVISSDRKEEIFLRLKDIIKMQSSRPISYQVRG